MRQTKEPVLIGFGYRHLHITITGDNCFGRICACVPRRISIVSVDAGKEEIQAAHAEWLSRGSTKGGNCWGGGEPNPSACKEPVPKRRKLPGPSLDELRLQEEANRQMEQFWTKILLGDIAVGAVLLAPEGAVMGAIRWLSLPGRWVPVTIP